MSKKIDGKKWQDNIIENKVRHFDSHHTTQIDMRSTKQWNLVPEKRESKLPLLVLGPIGFVIGVPCVAVYTTVTLCGHAMEKVVERVLA